MSSLSRGARLYRRLSPPRLLHLSKTAFHDDASEKSASRAQPLFDSRAKALQKARAALSDQAGQYEYLRNHMASVVTDRLGDISTSFPQTLDLFCGSAHIFRSLSTLPHVRAKIDRLFHADIHRAVVNRASQHFDGHIANSRDAFVFDECKTLPFQPSSLDAVVSAGGLHWVSDIPTLLLQIRASLRPDGVFIGAMLGGNTLQELRISMQLAEDEIYGRIAPRISPMIHLRDVASLLSAAGFSLPTADVDTVVITFKDMHSLMSHLRGMGETNALRSREIHFGRGAFERASRIYEERFGIRDDDGICRIPATFQMMHMIGWAPSETQPRALRRGSASVSLTDFSPSSQLPSTS